MKAGTRDTYTDQLAALDYGESLDVTFIITQEDIRNGGMADCYNCPAALALARVLPDLMPDVGRHIVDLYDDTWSMLSKRPAPGILYRAYAGPRLTEFIDRFDSGYSGYPPEPGAFLLTFRKYQETAGKGGNPDDAH